MGVGSQLECVEEEEEASPLETRRGLALLRDKLKRQAKISLGWKTRFRDENRLVTKLKQEKESYLSSVQSQLLIFESHLQKSRKELDLIVKHKNDVIRRQHHLICSLTLALIKNDCHKDLQKILPGLCLQRTASDVSKNNNNNNENNNDDSKVYETVTTNNLLNEQDFSKDKKQSEVISSSKNDFESLNDSDSAIMMEDAYDSLIALPVGKGEVKVMRSVSDALEIISRGVSSSLNHKPSPTSPSRRPGGHHGSLSSTPSCSSSESDESPTSTISKCRPDHLHLNGEQLNTDILRHRNISTNGNLPLSSSTPNSTYQPVINTGNVWEMSGFMCPKEEENTCDRGLCSSPCFHCSSSSSTTPLVSPSQTPSISPLATPPPSPNPYSGDSPPKSKYDFDSDATLSDGGQSDDGELDHHPGRRNQPLLLLNSPGEDISEDDQSTSSRFGSYEKLDNFDISYLKAVRTPKSETIQVTYNRVMSNHRSVTKPKDVKYKRINKAKSRSLEELRGKLKLYDGKQSASATAYAGERGQTSDA